MSRRDVMAGWPDWKRKIGKAINEEFKRAIAAQRPSTPFPEKS